MAKKIIILDRVQEAPLMIRCVLWADVPAPKQQFFLDAAFNSAYKGADAGELALLRSGAVAEKVDTLQIEPGATNAQIRQAFIALWTDWQNEITNYPKFSRYGTFWDGSTWTSGGA